MLFPYKKKLYPYVILTAILPISETFCYIIKKILKLLFAVARYFSYSMQTKASLLKIHTLNQTFSDNVVYINTMG